jgi:hypothetical protein
MLFLVPKLHLGTGLSAKLCFVQSQQRVKQSFMSNGVTKCNLVTRGARGSWAAAGLIREFSTQTARETPVSYRERSRGA